MRIPKKDIKRIENLFSVLEKCIKEENNWSAKNSTRAIKRYIDEHELPEDHPYRVRLRGVPSKYFFNNFD